MTVFFSSYVHMTYKNRQANWGEIRETSPLNTIYTNRTTPLTITMSSTKQTHIYIDIYIYSMCSANFRTLKWTISKISMSQNNDADFLTESIIMFSSNKNGFNTIYNFNNCDILPIWTSALYNPNILRGLIFSQTDQNHIFINSAFFLAINLPQNIPNLPFISLGSQNILFCLYFWLCWEICHRENVFIQICHIGMDGYSLSSYKNKSYITKAVLFLSFGMHSHFVDIPYRPTITHWTSLWNN